MESRSIFYWLCGLDCTKERRYTSLFLKGLCEELDYNTERTLLMTARCVCGENSVKKM